MDGEIFRYEWREPYLSDEPEDQYFSLGRNSHGWWYDGHPGPGHHFTPVSGGAERVKAFAEWLLSQHDEGERYFTGFDVADGDHAMGRHGLSVEISLERKTEDGPESLKIWHQICQAGGGPIGSCCAELRCENVDRSKLERAARALLAAAIAGTAQHAS